MSLAQKDAQDEAKSEQHAASADGGGGAADGGGGSGVGARRGNYYYAHGTVATDPNFSRPEKITAEEAARRQAALNGVGAVPGEHPGEHGARAGGAAEKLGPSSWNVKDYHWEETDRTEWARARLQELLGGVSADVGKKKGTVRVGRVGADGFLAVNVRKGKMKTFFELTVTVHWVGTLEDKRFGTTTVRGSAATRELTHEDATGLHVAPGGVEEMWVGKLATCGVEQASQQEDMDRILRQQRLLEKVWAKKCVPAVKAKLREFMEEVRVKA
jgi:hypothetical protein